MRSIRAGAMVVFLLLSAAIAFCQQPIADSLERRLPQSSGTAKVDLLNRLTYNYITRDDQKVVRYNDEAVRLAQKIRYSKGEGVAHTYRGVYEYILGNFEAAHRQFRQGLTLSRKVNDRKNISYTLLQRGVCGLEEVDPDSAQYFFKQAYQYYKDSTDAESLSKLYRNLSALYGQKFQLDSQQYYLDRALAIRRQLPDKSLLTDALIVQAGNKVASGAFAEANKLLDEAQQILKQYPDDEEDKYDVSYVRALILVRQGQFEKGVPLFDSARSYYLKASLFRKYVTLLFDMGKVFADRGDYELALNNLYDAQRLSRSRGFATETYKIQNRIGWVHFNLGDRGEALRIADEALAMRSPHVLKEDLANTLTLKGVILTDNGDFSHARPFLDSVFRMYQRVNHEQGMSEALMNLATLDAGMHRYSEALDKFNESIALASRVNYTFGLAWSNWGAGEMQFRLKNYRDAEAYLNKSEAFSRRIGSNNTLIKTYNTRRDLLAAQGQYKESLRYATLASELKDSMQHTDLARRFANLQKIQEIEQRDQNIRALETEKQQAQNMISLQESRLRQQYILIVGGVITILLLGTLVFIYYRFYSRIKLLNITITEKNKRIHGQATRLQEINDELNRLYAEVSEQKEEMQAQANELFESNRSISDLNRNLESLVAQKTVELRSTNDELVKHNNELLQFSYTVSHNLRGPVARLLGLSDLAQKESEIDQAKRWVSLISKTAHDLDIIIKDLGHILELRNQPHLFREQIDLAQEWRQSLSLLHDSLGDEDQIIADFSQLPELTGVRAMIQSIFYNLLSNAMKFRSPERSLRIRALSFIENDQAVIEVSDNGLGFDTELYKNNLFKLYKRFHSHVEGRGLGLYLVKQQVDLLDGRIEVVSKPGEGSLFRVVLPMALEPRVTTSPLL